MNARNKRQRRLHKVDVGIWIALLSVFLLSSVMKSVNIHSFALETRLYVDAYMWEWMRSLIMFGAVMICVMELLIALLAMRRGYRKVVSVGFCLMLTFFVSSCSNKIYNVVNCEPSAPIKEQQFWSNVTCKIHDIRCDAPISDIKDYCVTDSFCYILLSDNRIVHVDLNGDKVLSTFTKTGHAKDELIKASCITCDCNNVYVYDDGKSNIMKFSLNLKYEKNVLADCYLDKFIKCKEGFLCYTLGEGAYLTYLNSKGKKKSQFKLSNVSYDCRLCEQPFALDLSGNIFVKPELSDSIYVWKDGTLELNNLISFVGKKKTNDKCISSCDMIKSGDECSMNYMILDDYMLLSSMKDKNVRFYLYDLITQTCSYGVPPKQLGKYPFIPESQYGNRMFRILPKNECKAFVNIGNNNNMDNDIIILEYIY